MANKFEESNQEDLMKSFLEREEMVEKGQLEKEEEEMRLKKEELERKERAEEAIKELEDIEDKKFEIIKDQKEKERKEKEQGLAMESYLSGSNKSKDEIKKEDEPVDPIETTKESGKKEYFSYSRKAAEITLARIENFQDLWSETEQEGDKKFIEKTKEAWKEFVVHGVVGVDKETKEKTILNFTDLDGKCSLALLRLAGINTRNVEYVKPGESKDGKINLDTGDRDGLVIEDEGKTVFMDHHGDASGKDTSATKVVYDALTNLGLLKKEEGLDDLVEFVTQVDNKNYPDETKHFKYSWQTILGLQRFVPTKHLINFFKEGRSPLEKLSKEDLKKMGLLKRSEEQKDVIDSSLLELERMESNGFIIPSDYYGKIAVDIGKKIKGGFDAVRFFGCDNYIIWSPEEKSFFVSTTKPLSSEFDLSQGKKVRETMWIKPRQDNIPLTIKLQEILDEMTGGEFESEGELKKLLEKERLVTEKYSWISELTDDQVKRDKIISGFEKMLKSYREIDMYKGFNEKSLEQIVIDQIKKSFERHKK